MKISNFALVFLIAILGLVPFIDYKIDNLEVLSDKAIQYNAVMDLALDTAVANIVESDSGEVSINKDECVGDFMRSLYAGFGIIDNPDACAEFDMYVPVIVIADVDGFYVRYYEYQQNDYTTVTKWSTKYPYVYTDSRCTINFRLDENVQMLVSGYDTVYEGNYKTLLTKYRTIDTGSGTPGHLQYAKLADACQHNDLTAGIRDASPLRDDTSFVLQRQQCVINCITEKMAYYLNKHNDVARSFGIQYDFRIPDSASSEMARTIQDITFMAVFQGLPVGIGTDDVYNKFCISGARIMKGGQFFVRKDTSDGFLYYHTSRCALGVNVAGRDETYGTAQQAAGTGAFPCPYCHP